MNDTQETNDTEPVAVELPIPVVEPAAEPTPVKNKGGRPRKNTAEPQMVLPDMPPAASTATEKPAPRKPRAGGEANITQITEGLTAAITALSQFTAPFLPAPPGVDPGLIWGLKPEEAKSIAVPTAKIAHRHGAGKALHPDVIDGLAIGYALLVIVKSRQELLYAIHVRRTNEPPQNTTVYPAATNSAAMAQNSAVTTQNPEAPTGPPKPVEDPAAVQGLGNAFREINLGASDGLGLSERVAELEGRL